MCACIEEYLLLHGTKRIWDHIHVLTSLLKVMGSIEISWCMYVQKNKRSAIISPYKQKVVLTNLLVTMSGWHRLIT